MTGKTNIVRLADNIAAKVNAKYCDVFVGEHGPDLRFKGSVDDVANSAVYVNFTHGLEQLRLVGAINQAAYDAAVSAVERDAIPKTGLSVGLLKRDLVVLREKPAGAKHGTIKITVQGEAPPSPSAQPPAGKGVGPDGAAPAANGNGHANPTREKRSAIYLAQTNWVLNTIVPLYKGAGVAVTANDVHSMVATLFIAETG